MSAAPLLVPLDSATRADRDLMGGKATSLLALASQGADVPAAFVLTTEAYRRWAAAGVGADMLRGLVAEGVGGLEGRTGLRLGHGLVVSVRSGAPVSMPGMMDTVLNAGIGAVDPGTPGFLCDARMRFLWQYAELVLGLDLSSLAEQRCEPSRSCNADMVASLEARLRDLASGAGKPWPQTPLDELVGAAMAVFASWQSPRAKLYRRMRRIDDTFGTAVTIQQMVFGNRDAASGSGVAFTRDPASGTPVLTGEFLRCGQGEEVVAGREAGEGLAVWRCSQPALHADLEALGRRLEATTHKAQEIEFTVESGRLFVLQCRPALLTVRAAARVAVDMAAEGLITQEQALANAIAHGFDPHAALQVLVVKPGAPVAGRGLAVGGGVAVGRIALSVEQSERLVRGGDPVVFVAPETSPGLLSVMQRAAALVTLRGGVTSHAAVVAREIGTPCVVGLGVAITDGVLATEPALREGDWVTVDGDTGTLHAGDQTIRASRSGASEVILREWASAKAQQQGRVDA